MSVIASSRNFNLIQRFRYLQLKPDRLHRSDERHLYRYTETLTCLPKILLLCDNNRFLLMLRRTTFVRGHKDQNSCLVCEKFWKDTPQSPVQTRNAWRPNTIQYCFVTKHVAVVLSSITITNMFNHRPDVQNVSECLGGKYILICPPPSPEHLIIAI